MAWEESAMSVEVRRRFNESFKREAVQLAFHSGRRLSEVSKELGVRPDMLQRWKSQFESSPAAVAESSELRRLRRELSRTRGERDILKNSRARLATLSRETGIQ
jgi:transposase